MMGVRAQNQANQIFDLKGNQLLYSTGTYTGTRLEATFDQP
jgi:hypothetical protein